MESKANYAVIGALVLLTLFAIVAFVFYISGRQIDTEYDYYIVEYHSPPRGISVGSEVRYNGLKMGEVIRTELDRKDPNKVLVTIQVQADTPVHTDSYGQNEPLGLTGLSYIQLFAGKSGVLLDGGIKGGKLPVIEGRASQLDNLIGGSESVIENINSALVRAANVFSPEATQDLHEILANINVITANLKKADLSDERIDKFMQAIEKAAIDVSTASLAVDKSAKDISAFLAGDDIKAIMERTNNTLIAAQASLEEYTRLAKSATELSDESIRMLEQFSATGLQDLSAAMADLKHLIETLNRVSEDLERSPVDFIVGSAKEETKLPQ